MPSAEYTVRLDAFEGPLDLLLFLIRRAEVEVGDIPIAQITEQYLRYLEQLGLGAEGGAGAIDIERAGEFLVMAATLMEIKSRMLAPIVPAEGAVEEADAGGRSKRPEADPRAELVKQLLEYKRYRDASAELERYRHEWEDRFPAARAMAGKEDAPEAAAEEAQGPVDLEDVQLIDLVEAFARIIETVDLTRVGEHRVVMDDTPVEIHAEDIVDRLRREEGGTGEMRFARLFEGRTRSDMIGLFLAVLELVKQQRVRVRQDDGGAAGAVGQITIGLKEEADEREGGGGEGDGRG